MIRVGDRVLVLTDDGSRYLITLREGSIFGTHLGNILHEEIIGKEYGDTIKIGRSKAHILKPGIVDYVFNLNRRTQIVYPKDMGFIILMLDIKEGDLVIECGSGSGSMTGAFARYVGSKGKVVSYERREKFLERARENIDQLGIGDRVEFKLKDIGDGIDEKGADAFFLDVPDPVPYLSEVLSSLKGGGRLCVLCPTVNQVQSVLESLNEKEVVDIEVWETFIRKMKTNPKRFRPEDRMVGHTAYLIFGVKVSRGGEKYEE
ncbi:SAM-dependent methyltransferase [Kosmotoga arenicorallina S304]|uniref:tRNA (adenine(58)-N(1))-methyltransferase TrmI n=1 Tax=Kosmotoga arenicorallina S304 TaxID=1453497 RepID=A0A176K152_9BACT|nr:tRNA (adenine-N1)-methyltransferase [Kosmotoga arenicorallina]OAA30415.1 SAM-dependent methyltransferase [Kosmotoga arenicorallina S304]